MALQAIVTSRFAARAAAAAGVCVLWLFIGAAGDKGLGGELGREKIDILAGQLTAVQRLDSSQNNAAEAPQFVPAPERKQFLEHEQAWDRAEALARALTASLQRELDTVRSTAEAARIKQRRELDQERSRADALARDLATLQAQLDTARIVGQEAVLAVEEQIKQAQAFEQEKGRAENLERELAALRTERDAARIVVPEAEQAAAAEVEQKQAVGRELKQQRDSTEALTRELTSVRAELDTARAAGQEAVRTAEAAKTEREQAFEKERDRAETLARELASAQQKAGERSALLAAAHAEMLQVAKTNSAVTAEQKQALASERDRADALTRELAALRAELDTARNTNSNALQAAETETKQKQAQEQEVKLERDKAEGLARELASARAELDTTRAAGLEAARTAEAAKIEQQKALRNERNQTETLARELASTRKKVDERSALLAAAYAEVLQVAETNSAAAAEQKQALASERERADALARELASARTERQGGGWQIAAIDAFLAVNLGEHAVDSSRARVAASTLSMIEGKRRPAEPISGETVASNPKQSSASDLPRPEAPSTSRQDASDFDPGVVSGPVRSTSAGAVSRSSVDEQRLLARANALLRQADISGARPLLEHALEHGSARAAFMLAETYDARVLRSWRARGIPGDLARARELYQRAQAGGIADATERIEALK